MNTKETADRLNEWIGQDHPQTDLSVASLVWAMSMDPDMYKAFCRDVDFRAAEHRQQMGLVEESNWPTCGQASEGG